MGKITAGVTHEMKNVLAIIKESAGLMEDLMALHKGPPPPYQQKFFGVIVRIKQQVERGVDLAGKLNTFAHSPDDVAAEIDLSAVVEQVASLSERFARLKGVALKVAPPSQPAMLITDPLKIRMLLFNGIDLLLSTVQSGTTIVLRSDRDSDADVSVTFASEEPVQKERNSPTDLNGSPQWRDFIEQASELTATVIAKPAPAWFAVQFRKRS
jgi:C4-dicarboxylate-specific signal transduction histidine kinase